MRDIDFDDDSHEKAGTEGSGRWPRLLGVGIVAILMLMIVPIPISSSRHSTCVLCRFSRWEDRFLVFSESKEEENACSRWYAGNVEPSHRHTWDYQASRKTVSLLAVSYGCRGGGPIFILDPSTQLDIYRHFSNPSEAERLFVRVNQRDKDSRRLFEALVDWVNAGYPGTWDEWLEKHPASPN